MAWSPCPLKRFPGARQPDHRLPACSHRFQAITPRVTRVRFTPTTTRNTRHVHRTHHFYRLAAALHRYLPILRKFPLFLSFPFASPFSLLRFFKLFSRSHSLSRPVLTLSSLLLIYQIITVPTPVNSFSLRVRISRTLFLVSPFLLSVSLLLLLPHLRLFLLLLLLFATLCSLIVVPSSSSSSSSSVVSFSFSVL